MRQLHTGVENDNISTIKHKEYIMKKQIFGVALVAMIFVALSGCEGQDNERYFRAELVDGGTSVRIVEYLGDSFGVRIPSRIQNLPVTHIGSNAFEESNLTSVTIPNSVTTIEWSAFANNQLNRVTIGNSVTVIQGGAFANNQLTSITIPNSVTFIDAEAFAANQLNSLRIGNSLIAIGEMAFRNNQLTNIIIPSHVVYIGENAFVNNLIPVGQEPVSAWKQANSQYNNFQWSPYFRNDRIGVRIDGYTGESTDINIPSRLGGLPVTEIGSSAFSRGTQARGAARNLPRLTSVTIPNTVYRIGSWSFQGNQLTSIVIPDSVIYIHNVAFANNQLTSVIIPDSVTRIWGQAFAFNPLTSVSVPSGANINDDAFQASGGRSVTVTRR